MDCIFFINPTAGTRQGERLAKEIEAISPSAPVTSTQVVFTDMARLSSQVLSLAPNKDLLIICGGDGTVSNIIESLLHLETIPPIAIIPIGTGNDIARSTGWFKSWELFGLDGIFLAIKEKKTVQLDTWGLDICDSRCKTEKSYCFAAYAGLGYDGKVCKGVSELSRKFSLGGQPSKIRQILYMIAGIKILFSNLPWQEKIKFSMNGENFLAGQLLFCNVNYYAGGSKLIHSRNFSDGLFDVLIFKGFFSYIRAIFQGRILQAGSRAPGADILLQGGNATMILKTPCYLQIDGEAIGNIDAQSRIKVEFRRVVPILKPLEHKEAFSREKTFVNTSIVEKASSVTPAIG